jgi:hypothetical protein
MEADAGLPWAPQVGTYTLTLVDEQGRILDAVQFEVRGPVEEGDQDHRLQTTWGE